MQTNLENDGYKRNHLNIRVVRSKACLKKRHYFECFKYTDYLKIYHFLNLLMSVNYVRKLIVSR